MTAPAPSPNSTQVVRSLKSRMRENISAPTTSAVRCWPLRMSASAIASGVGKARADGLDVERGAVVLDPSLFCSKHAVLGKTKSGVDVATTIRSIDWGSIPGRLDRALRSDEREIARRHVGIGEMPGMNAGARDNPLVARFDVPLGETIRQLLIRDAVGRQIAAGAEHAGIDFLLGHYAFEETAAQGSAGRLEGLAPPAPPVSARRLLERVGRFPPSLARNVQGRHF